MPELARNETSDFQVIRAGGEHREAILSTLCRAFDQDAFVNWYASERNRAASFRHFFEGYLDVLSAPYGDVYAVFKGPDEESCLGAALWVPPGKWNFGIVDQLRQVGRMVQITGLRKFPSRLKHVQRILKVHPTVPHYYLLAIGVAPEYQRQGLGGKLLQPILDRSDRENVPSFLETTMRGNLPFYQKHGFEIKDTLDVNGDMTVWTMLRSPQVAQ